MMGLPSTVTVHRLVIVTVPIGTFHPGMMHQIISRWSEESKRRQVAINSAAGVISSAAKTL